MEYENRHLDVLRPALIVLAKAHRTVISIIMLNFKSGEYKSRTFGTRARVELDLLWCLLDVLKMFSAHKKNLCVQIYKTHYI